MRDYWKIFQKQLIENRMAGWTDCHYYYFVKVDTHTIILRIVKPKDFSNLNKYGFKGEYTRGGLMPKFFVRS